MIEEGTLLRKSPEKPMNNNVPVPIFERLEQLMEVANGKGAGTNRKELLAAIILAAPEEGLVLVDLVLAYRMAPSAQANVHGRDVSDVLTYRQHPRGPRRRLQAV
jgi:hypothetical protein